MRNCAARVVAGTCLLFFFLPPSARAQSRPVRPTALPFHLSHGMLVVIPGRIGKLRNLRFVLDTGTTQTVVDRSVRDRLHLSCRPGSPLVSFNRALELEQCTLPEIEIGSFRLKGLPVYVARLPELSVFLDKADALIGLDVLGASKFTIDYAAHKVTFDSMKRPALPPANDPDDPLCMTAVIQVQGHPIRLIVDTGVRGVLLYEDRLRRKVPHLRLEGTAEHVNIGGRLPAKRVTLPGVRLGNAETNWVVLLIASPPKNELPGIDGFLGISTLNALSVTLDFNAKILSWKR